MTPPLKLKPISFMVLGMLRLGATSGYAIKKAADLSTDFFWPTSLAQVYPELSRLEQAGLVEKRDDPHGARERDAYELTDVGRRPCSPGCNPRTKCRSGFARRLLRLFFADALPREDHWRWCDASAAAATATGMK